MSKITEVVVTKENDTVPTAFENNNVLVDPGNHSAEHFKKGMSPMRFACRQYMRKFTDNQSEYLANWQSKVETPFRDWYYTYSATLGSHTFYVIFLPMPVWFGYYELTRDLVYILGYSIYLSGYLKDFLCLPRPKSPPVKRITLSHYTTKEYGAPSSHSANATGATMYFIYCIWFCSAFSTMAKVGFSLVACFYYYTLVMGRIYCGMHGILDIVTGSMCGAFVFFARIVLSYIFRDFRCGEYLFFPIISLAVGLTILFKHVRPIDECPCFADSVAFIGVASGYEIGDWIIQKFLPNLSVSFYSDIGKIVFLRPLVAVPIIVLWKEVISKPLIYTILIKILRLPDDRERIHKKRLEMSKDHECSLHVGEPNIEIIGRYLIYAGVPMATTIVCPLVFKLLNIL